MDHLLEIAKILASDSRKASSTNDFSKSAESVGEGAKNLVYIVLSIETEERMGHLPAGVASKAKKLVLDLFTEQYKDIYETSNILQHMLASAGRG